MNTSNPFFSPRGFLCALAASAALLATGCSRSDRDRAEAKAKEAYADTKAALSNAWDRAKAYSFDQRDQFAAHAKALSAQMEAQVSKVRADAADAHASAQRRAAAEELKNAEADYQQKVAALGDATSATWDSAKQNVIAAWDRLQAAYYKARAD